MLVNTRERLVGWVTDNNFYVFIGTPAGSVKFKGRIQNGFGVNLLYCAKCVPKHKL